ncbi:hypothetical protein [Actinacidiphila bryophytorum]|uniref:hypothetical protein n=1 Tax=Actinacidiphila bryophytorum TaxID=1436133 RepID=UPI00196075B1|nr:hypothetical protein [Actinacidiphila bryophytorum]MBM9439132.1 hypothetical protein [Actinacidiphila bryophytorum]MBN6544273.1 hypothetical protein [Actinacidiphila bryophytorum]
MRLLPAAVLLLAVCAAAGCTTVSAPPPAAVPAPTRPAPGVVELTPPPARPLLATVRPDAGEARVATGAPSGAVRTQRRRPAAKPHGTPPVRHRAPRSGAPRPRPAPRGGGSGLTSGVCALGRTYGGWAAGSAAATICARAYGS